MAVLLFASVIPAAPREGCVTSSLGCVITLGIWCTAAAPKPCVIAVKLAMLTGIPPMLAIVGDAWVKI